MAWVAYLRVSTTQQGESGLGLAAQKDVVMRFIVQPVNERQKRTSQFHIAESSMGTVSQIQFARYFFGLNHICSGLPALRMDENWTVDGLTRLRKHVESFGIRLEMVPLPMGSDIITRANYPNIILGRTGRDQEIAEIQTMIRNAGK